MNDMGGIATGACCDSLALVCQCLMELITLQMVTKLFLGAF